MQPSISLLFCASALLCARDVECSEANSARDDLRDSGEQLQWKKVNILHITDVHSYISGHRHGDSTVNTGWGSQWGNIDTAPQDADYADLVSAIEHLKSAAALQGKTLFVVNSGDVVDGTGISNLSPVNGEYLTPLLRHVPFDALTIGNHELYQDATVEHMVQSQFIRSWNGSYITSNVLSAASGTVDGGDSSKSVGQPLGERYRILHGSPDEHGEPTVAVMVFGFLYEMTDHCDNVNVTALQTAVTQPWFSDALDQIAAQSVDAVTVLAHMDWNHTDTYALSDAVRARYPHMPITFMAGHTHYRRFTRRDNRAVSMESGNYFNTLGFLSFDPPSNAHSTSSEGTNTEVDFFWRMVDANKATLRTMTDTTESSFMTERGVLLRRDIDAVRASMGLDNILGCNPASTALLVGSSTPLSDNHSAWGVLMREVVPEVLFTPPHNPQMWEVESTGGLRKNLDAGTLTVDDLIQLSPFGNKYWRIPDVPGATVASMYHHMLYEPVGEHHAWSGEGKPPFAATETSPDTSPSRTYDVICNGYDKSRAVMPALVAVDSSVDWPARIVPYRQSELDSSTLWSRFACTSSAWDCSTTAGAARNVTACDAAHTPSPEPAPSPSTPTPMPMPTPGHAAHTPAPEPGHVNGQTGGQQQEHFDGDASVGDEGTAGALLWVLFGVAAMGGLLFGYSKCLEKRMQVGAMDTGSIYNATAAAGKDSTEQSPGLLELEQLDSEQVQQV